VTRPLRPLDPLWWRRRDFGYDQQDGRAQLRRLHDRSTVTGWALYVDGEYRGQWSTLAQAKQRAAELTLGATP
jgi:hypothetical protein